MLPSSSERRVVTTTALMLRAFCMSEFPKQIPIIQLQHERLLQGQCSAEGNRMSFLSPSYPGRRVADRVNSLEPPESLPDA